MHNLLFCIYFIKSLTATPIITLQPKGTTVHVGAAKIEMKCSAVSHGTIDYHWEKYDSTFSNWIKLSENQQTDINNVSTYRIDMPTEDDDGIYRCVATNIDGSGYSDSVTITVYGTYVGTYIYT